MIGWNFPLNNGGLETGFNDAAIDTFAGKRLSSLVREVIQNSLDAKKRNNQPVRLSFDLNNVSRAEFSGFHDLLPHLQKSMSMARKQKIKHAIDFYKSAIDYAKNNDEVPVLCIHDYNTKGLDGPIDRPGAWSALVKGTGINHKSGVGALGAFGHGSKAPFCYSRIRSVFYYTKVKKSGKITEERFQGKSILQSHECPIKSDLTQGTGFFGEIDGVKPLIDKKVPGWAKNFRKTVTDDTGTSVYVPFTQYRDDLFPETRITIIANFFYAIYTGGLEVTVDKTEINKSNVEEVYRDCVEKLDTEQDDIDVAHVKNCFESIKTIIEADEKNDQRIPGFGEIQWYLRLNEDLDKRVGISRSSGMLITRKAPFLEKFNNIKPFDMFVSVTDDHGSEILRRLENPSHDNFEFDRITSETERQGIKRQYKNFCKKIRDLLEQYAAVAVEEEESVTGLSGLFGEVSDADQGHSKHFERGVDILVRDGPSIIPRPPRKRSSKPTGGQQLGSGMQGGSKNKREKGGSNPDPNGTRVIVGTEPNGDKASGEKYKVRNLRVSHLNSKNNNANLFFDSPTSGKCLLRVSMVGEHGEFPVKFDLNGKELRDLEIDVSQAERCKISVSFSETVKNVALEASLVELET